MVLDVAGEELSVGSGSEQDRGKRGEGCTLASYNRRVEAPSFSTVCAGRARD